LVANLLNYPDEESIHEVYPGSRLYPEDRDIERRSAMRHYILIAFIPLSMFVIFMLISPALIRAQNVRIQIGLPHLVFPGPPGMAVIPNTYVYYPPEADENIFFYRGCWYRPHQGLWFSAPHYNGPWDPVEIKRVPRPVLAVPAGYRYGPVHGYVPYGQVKKNWRNWERNHQCCEGWR